MGLLEVEATADTALFSTTVGVLLLTIDSALDGRWEDAWKNRSRDGHGHTSESKEPL